MASSSRRVSCFFGDSVVVLAGTISGMFKSARVPRADRWTGFFCRPLGWDGVDPRYADLRFSGHTTLALRRGDEVEIVARYRDRARDPKCLDIVDVRRVLPRSSIRSAVRGRTGSVDSGYVSAALDYFGPCAAFALAHLSVSDPAVADFMVSTGIPASTVTLMRVNCEASFPTAALRAAFPSAVGTNVMTGMCLYVSRGLDADAAAGDRRSPVQRLVERVRADPYWLLSVAERVDMRFRFDAVDRVATVDCGVPLSDPARLRVCAALAFREVCLGQGHACWDVSDPACVAALTTATARAARVPGFSATDLYNLVTAPGSGFALSECGGRRYLYSAESWREEVAAAAALRAAISGPGPLADVAADRARMSVVNGLVCQYYVTRVGQDAPAEAYAFVHRAIRSRVSVLTGGPGSGKTTAVRCLIYVLRELLGDSDPRATPVLTAPTGMAAKRLRDAVSAGGYDVAASTAAYWVCRVRGALESAGDDSARQLSELRAALDGRVLVVDETSMMDLPWSSDFLTYFLSTFHCAAVFIGDRDQLPSVGYGEVFEHLCMLEPDVPVTTLVGSNRVAKDRHVLLDNFERVNSGHVMASLDWSEPDVFSRSWFSGPSADEDAARELVAEYRREVGSGTPPAAVRILTPVHNGALGTFALNRAAQDVVNPASGAVATSSSAAAGDEIPGASFGPREARRAFRVGDRVVLTRNVDDLANGECGVVELFDERWSDEAGGAVGYVRVTFEDVSVEPSREFPVSAFERDFLPAYATTIHKAQGMEYDVVLMACPQAFARPGFGVRNLPFTAMTRARARVALFGREGAVDAAVLSRRRLRCSLLAHRVRGLVRDS